MSRAEIFSEIFRTNAWNSKETHAGPGSEVGATSGLSVGLLDYITAVDARSVLDAGCNDCNWQPDLPGYIGVDIVPEAIEIARQRHPDRTFIVADICTDELPQVEIVLCRDALQHMSFADGLYAVENFRKTGAWLLLAGTFEHGRNVNITTGGYYEPNLTKPPFSLGDPAVEFPDDRWASGVVYPGKSLAGFLL